MTPPVIQPTDDDRDRELCAIDRMVDLDAPLHTNPLRGAYHVCGAIRGLDVPWAALQSLASAFGDSEVRVLAQNQTDLGEKWLVKVTVNGDPETVVGMLNREYAGIFAADLNVFWGQSRDWLIVFSAQLALGMLVTYAVQDCRRGSTAYGVGDRLEPLEDAIEDCLQSDAQGFERHSGEDFKQEFRRSWGLQDCSR